MDVLISQAFDMAFEVFAAGVLSGALCVLVGGGAVWLLWRYSDRS